MSKSVDGCSIFLLKFFYFSFFLHPFCPPIFQNVSFYLSISVFFLFIFPFFLLLPLIHFVFLRCFFSSLCFCHPLSSSFKSYYFCLFLISISLSLSLSFYFFIFLCLPSFHVSLLFFLSTGC